MLSVATTLVSVRTPKVAQRISGNAAMGHPTPSTAVSLTKAHCRLDQLLDFF